MRAGELRQRITIQQATDTQAASGETTQTWTTYKAVFAKIEPASGQETWRAAQVNPLLTHAVTIRYLRGVESKMRVKYEDARAGTTRYFGIEAVIDREERGIEMQLMCIEDVDG